MRVSRRVTAVCGKPRIPGDPESTAAAQGVAVPAEILLGEHGAHAVAEQHALQAGKVCAHALVQAPGIVDHPVPAVVAQVAEPMRVGAPMAPVIVAVDDVPGRVQPRGDGLVTADMLAHPVGDLNRRPGRVTGSPAACVQRLAVRSLEVCNLIAHGGRYGRTSNGQTSSP